MRAITIRPATEQEMPAIDFPLPAIVPFPFLTLTRPMIPKTNERITNTIEGQMNNDVTNPIIPKTNDEVAAEFPRYWNFLDTGYTHSPYQLSDSPSTAAECLGEQVREAPKVRSEFVVSEVE
jgi:hypothetical protein